MFQSFNASLKCRLLMLAACLTAVCSPASAWAAVKAADIFGSNMVLQQGMEVPVWGTADAGQQVTVSFDGQKVTAKADANGKWMTKLSSLKATANQKGQTLTIQGSGADDVVTFEDVLIGEVWLCSGQSNMSFYTSQSFGGKEAIAAANFPELRMFKVASDNSQAAPIDTLKGNWQVCTPGTAGSFYAVPFYYGRDLQQKLGIPVGVIQSSVGGTAAQAWVSFDALKTRFPEYIQEYVDIVNPGKVQAQKHQEVVDRQQLRLDTVQKIIAIEADDAASMKMASQELDDSSWKTLELPSNWLQQPLRNFLGMLWVRKTIDVPAAWAGKDLVLNAGVINTIDETWFNGQKVGQTMRMTEIDTGRHASQQRSGVREYRVPGKFVKAGPNVIAIRIISYYYRQGGVTRNNENEFKIKLASDNDGSSAIALDGKWQYETVLEIPGNLPYVSDSNRPTVLYSGMIHPLIPYAMRGAVWYQGESNTRDAVGYRLLMTTLIEDWRSRWGQKEFDFLVVQLPNFGGTSKTPQNASWAILRDSQRLLTKDLPGVHMAVTIDIGEARDIHPRNKADVGKRLMLVALNKTYGKDVIASGPTYQSHQIKGSQIVVQFDNVHGGLVNKNASGSKVEGFGIAGADGQFVWADAVIQGDTVVVSSDQIASPVYVNYAWDGNPPVSLFNKADLPAAPFTTAGY